MYERIIGRISTLKRALCIIAAVCLLLIGTYFGLHAYIRWRLKKEYPWISIGKLQVSTDGLLLSDVRFHRQDVFGSVPKVRVSTSKDVYISGGAIELNMCGSDSPNSKADRKVILDGVDITLRKSGLSVWAKKVKKTPDGNACADEAVFEHPDARGTLTYPCLDRDRDIVSWVQGKVTTKYFTDATINDGKASRRDKSLQAKHISVALGQPPLVQSANDLEVAVVSSETVLAVAKSFTIENPILNTAPLRFERPISAKFESGTLTVDFDSVEIRANTLERAIEGSGLCSDWVGNLPQGLQKPLEGLEFTGSLSFFVGLKDPKVKISSNCKVSCKTDRIRTLSRPFHYDVYRADGKTMADRITGPGSKGWVYLTEVSPFVPPAVIAMEDPGFMGHRGWIAGAFENSLKDNLRYGKFLRGGSTITMQLAKNIWLKREKTIGRKVQEFFLASALESCLSKDRILELYLNVVEFGPNVYGIGEAAKYRFDSSPAALDPRQAFWLAKILPNPRRAGRPSEADLERVDPLIQRVSPGLEVGPIDTEEEW